MGGLGLRNSGLSGFLLRTKEDEKGTERRKRVGCRKLRALNPKPRVRECTCVCVWAGGGECRKSEVYTARTSWT